MQFHKLFFFLVIDNFYFVTIVFSFPAKSISFFIMQLFAVQFTYFLLIAIFFSLVILISFAALLISFFYIFLNLAVSLIIFSYPIFLSNWLFTRVFNIVYPVEL